jgi:hypothetical protein
LAYLTTQGKMLSANITQGSHAGGGHRIVSYRPVVSYEYTVGGTTYTGTRATQMDVGAGAVSDVQKFLASRPPGSTVTVYYNPDNPADSFLEQGMGSIGKRGINMAIAITLATVVIVLGATCVFILFFAASVGVTLIPLFSQ